MGILHKTAILNMAVEDTKMAFLSGLTGHAVGAIYKLRNNSAG